MSTMLTVTITAPTTSLDRRSSEVAFLRKALAIVETELGRGHGNVTSGTIIGCDTAGGTNKSLGSWTYTASASLP